MWNWYGPALYSFLASVALKGTLILAAAWTCAALLRDRSAGVRHLVWTAGFIAVLALPMLSWTLPSLRVPVNLSPAAIFRTNAATNAPDQLSVPGGSASAIVPGGGTRRYPIDWRVGLLLVWAAGTALSMTQMLAALAALRRVRRGAPHARAAEGESYRKALGIESAVNVVSTRPGSMPATCGIFRPAVLLPADAVSWSGERFRMVLLHELGHIRRVDPATHLLARTALALFWWNPLAWHAWREFLKERERATDDLVLSAGARASEYAEHLLEIARSRQSAPALGWAAIAMARRSQLEGRLLAILDSKQRRRIASRGSIAAAALIALVLMAPLAALRAQNEEQTVPADVDATIRAAAAQKNHQMLEAAAGAAVAYGRFDLAQKLLESSLAIREQVSGQQSVDYAVGLLKLGDLERNRDNFDEAEAFYARAVSLLSSGPEAARALVDLGTYALMKKNPEQAIDYFQRAQVADPQHAGPALMWLAVVREQQQNVAETEALYRQALATTDPSSAQAATTMDLFARFLERQGRDAEAKPLQDQASALRQELGQHAVAVRQVSAASALRMGPGMTAPSLLYKVEPEYSEEARIAKYQGTVVVTAVIGVDGTAQGMKVVRGLGLGLDDKALQAVSQWRFKPGIKDGQPVPVIAQIEVNFRLL
jgi:TonB family protein